jgi:hypothetical protein
MKKRYNRWMADWRDEHGRRHRKGFTTRKAAAQYQATMVRAVQRKKARASAALATSAERGAKQKKATVATPRQRATSGPSPASSPRTN